MTDHLPAPLAKDYSLQEVAAAMGMSPRWVRDRIKYDDVECQKYGHKIRFTEDQVAKFRAAHSTTPAVAPMSITTGRRKR